MTSQEYDLSGVQIDQINKAIKDAYRYAELRYIVRTCMDVDTDEVLPSGAFKDQVFALVNWAARQGRVEELVRCACKGNPGNKQLQDVYSKVFQGGSSSSATVTRNPGVPAVPQPSNVQQTDTRAEEADDKEHPAMNSSNTHTATKRNRPPLDTPIFNTILQIFGGLIAALVVAVLSGEVQFPVLVVAALLLSLPVVMAFLYWVGGRASFLQGIMVAVLAAVLVFGSILIWRQTAPSPAPTTSVAAPTETSTVSPTMLSTATAAPATISALAPTATLAQAPTATPAPPSNSAFVAPDSLTEEGVRTLEDQLAAVNILLTGPTGSEQKRQDVRSYLTGEHTGYQALVRSCLALLQGRQFKRPVHLDTINGYYVKLIKPGAETIQPEEYDDLAKLEQAILKHWFDVYGEKFDSLDSIVEP